MSPFTTGMGPPIVGLNFEGREAQNVFVGRNVLTGFEGLACYFKLYIEYVLWIYLKGFVS